MDDNTNNGLIEIPYLGFGSLVIDSAVTLTLDGNSDFTGEGIFTLAGGLDVQVPVIFEDGLTFQLADGTIDNAHNLTLPGTVEIAGGTLNGSGSGTDIMSIPVFSDTDITINSSNFIVNDLELDWPAHIVWNVDSPGADITLNDSTLVAGDRLEIMGSASTSVMNGTNGQLIIRADSFLTLQADGDTTIGVPVDAQGHVQQFSTSGALNFSDAAGLTLSNGGVLEGDGLISGLITVNSGGVIAPGFSTSGTSTIQVDGQVIFNPGSAAIFSLGEIDGLDSDAIVASDFNGDFGTHTVTINGGSLYMNWTEYYDGMNSSNVAATVALILADENVTGAFTTIYDPISVTASTLTDAALGVASFEYTIDAVDAVTPFYYWDGDAGNDLWSDPINWEGTVSDQLPGAGEFVMVETSNVQMFSTEPASGAFADVQLSVEDLELGSGAQLNVDGNLFNYGEIFSEDNVTIGGTGTWHNLGFAGLNGDSSTLSINTIENYAPLLLGTLTTDPVNFTISSTVLNNGNIGLVGIYSSDARFDFSGGISNFGLTEIFGSDNLQVGGNFFNLSGSNIEVRTGGLEVVGSHNFDGVIDGYPGFIMTVSAGSHGFADAMNFGGALVIDNATVNVEGDLDVSADNTDKRWSDKY